MSPLAHLFLTAVLFFILKLFLPLNYAVLFFAFFLTLLIDLLDHSIQLLIANNPDALKIKALLFSGNISKAYNLYYNTRRKNARQTLFHNIPFLILIIILSFYFRSFALFIGIAFHLICDISYEYYQYKSLSFIWTFGLINLDNKQTLN